MAGLSQDKNSGFFRIFFRWGGRAFNKSLKTKDQAEANRRCSRIEELLDGLNRGLLTLPEGADLWEWLWSDRTRTEKPRLEKSPRLTQLFQDYFERIEREGAKEEETIRGERIHSRHLLRILGDIQISHLTRDILQGYVQKRLAEKGKRGNVRAPTIHKELETLRFLLKKANLPFPGPITLPKRIVKHPFRTWAQIMEIVERGGLSKAELKDLWDCVFLNRGEIEEFLEFVRTKPRKKSPYFYPVCVFLAHTGCRLSEALRSRREDFIVSDSIVVQIREKKRSKSSLTYRTVPVSPKLWEVLQDYWAKKHPGGPYTFSYHRGRAIKPLGMRQSHMFLLKGSKWAVLKGFHVLRHSFASNLAAAGIDQRIIDELMGHSTEEMRSRYRHLFPQAKQEAINTLWGPPS